MKNKKQFTVTFESDDRTRWIMGEVELLQMLQCLCKSAGAAMTSGSEPKCTVLPVNPKLEDAVFHLRNLDPGSNFDEDRLSVCQAIEEIQNLLPPIT